MARDNKLFDLLLQLITDDEISLFTNCLPPEDKQNIRSIALTNQSTLLILALVIKWDMF